MSATSPFRPYRKRPARRPTLRLVDVRDMPAVPQCTTSRQWLELCGILVSLLLVPLIAVIIGHVFVAMAP